MEEVGEGGVTDLEGEDGGIWDGGVADEIVAIGIGLGVDGGVGNLEALETVETWGVVSNLGILRWR